MSLLGEAIGELGWCSERRAVTWPAWSRMASITERRGARETKSVFITFHMWDKLSLVGVVWTISTGCRDQGGGGLLSTEV